MDDVRTQKYMNTLRYAKGYTSCDSDPEGNWRSLVEKIFFLPSYTTRVVNTSGAIFICSVSTSSILNRAGSGLFEGEWISGKDLMSAISLAWIS